MQLNTISEDLAVLSIFPAEIWKIIFGSVKDPQQYHNICSASANFRTLLINQAPEILFPEVAKLLLTVHLNSKIKYSKETLTCREVCRSWRTAVDRVLQHPSYYYNFPLETKPVDPSLRDDFDMSIKTFNKFTTVEQFAKYEEQSAPTLKGANPILGRGVVFKITERFAPPRRYMDECFQFLQKFGHHLWYCIFTLRVGEHASQVDFYNQLPAFLSLMPNLRALEIKDFETDLVALPKRLKNALVQGCRIQTYPTLRKFTHIYLFGVPIPVVKGIVQGNQQLENVDLSDEPCPDLPKMLKVYLENLPKLSKLLGAFCYEEDFDVFNDAKIVGQVEHLHLDVSSLTEMPLEQIFCTLENKFADNLTYLQLSIRFAPEELKGKFKGLRLNNLKSLDLKMNVAAPLRFLLPMRKTLEHLSLSTEETSKKEFKQALTKYKLNNCMKKDEFWISLYKNWRQPQNSSIWSVFSVLKVLKTNNHGLSAKPKWNISSRGINNVSKNASDNLFLH